MTTDTGSNASGASAKTAPRAVGLDDVDRRALPSGWTPRTWTISRRVVVQDRRAPPGQRHRRLADRAVLRGVAADRDRRDLARRALVGAAGRATYSCGVVDRGRMRARTPPPSSVDACHDVAGRRRDERHAVRVGDRDARRVLDREAGQAAVGDRRLDVRLLVEPPMPATICPGLGRLKRASYVAASPPRRSASARPRRPQDPRPSRAASRRPGPCRPARIAAIPSSSTSPTFSAESASSVTSRSSFVATSSDRPSSARVQLARSAPSTWPNADGGATSAASSGLVTPSRPRRVEDEDRRRRRCR